MVGVAILGAGIFARTEHLPALEASISLELKAVYSRSQSSASALAAEASSNPTVYFDSPSTPGSSLDDLLARDDISAVVVCLPIPSQPDIIRKAWKAGKHVISEKPIAKDMEHARELLVDYHKLEKKPVWAVAENYRYIPAVQLAAEKLKELGGEVTMFNFDMFTLVKTDNQYLNTAWRKAPQHQGGFVLDGGIHFVATIRYILAAANEKLTTVQASTSLLQPLLHPVDTVHGILTTGNGRSGIFNVSFGTASRSGLRFAVSTTKGEIEMTPVEVKITRIDGSAPEVISLAKSTGVKAELEAWASSLEGGVTNDLQKPEEALKDLEVLEALLTAGEKHSVVQLHA